MVCTSHLNLDCCGLVHDWGAMHLACPVEDDHMRAVTRSWRLAVSA